MTTFTEGAKEATHNRTDDCERQVQQYFASIESAKIPSWPGMSGN
jgi:hypothetical protein